MIEFLHKDKKKGEFSVQPFQTYFQHRVEELLASAPSDTAFFFRGLLPEQLAYLIHHPRSLLDCGDLLSGGTLNLAALEENRRALVRALSSAQGSVVGFYEELIALCSAASDLSLLYDGSITVVNNDLFDRAVPNCLTQAEAVALFDAMQSDEGPDSELVPQYYCDALILGSDDAVLTPRNVHQDQDFGWQSLFAGGEACPGETAGEALVVGSSEDLLYRLELMAGRAGEVELVVDRREEQAACGLRRALSSLGVPFSQRLADILAPETVYDGEQFLSLLRRHWGEGAAFRELLFYGSPSLSKETVPVSQGALIEEIVDQCERAQTEGESYRDVFITAPTGAGKSLLFQLPALHLAQKYGLVTLVVTPLIALMHDQAAQLETERGIGCATFLNSTISFEERQRRTALIQSGEKSIVYLAPELLLSSGLRPIVGERQVGLLVIDEAHTVTTWGRDFRPDYWFLGDFLRSAKREGRRFPVLCLTATAVYTGEDDVVNDTIAELGLHSPILHLGSVKRENILFDISPGERKGQEKTEEAKIDAIVRRLQTYVAKGQRFLVYCPFRTHVDAVFAALPAQAKSRVRRYYSGDRISDTERKMAEADYRDGRALGLICTKAFGMGVDVSDIQHIVHFAPSGSLADYVQEIGRAARDQTIVGVAHLDFFPGDIRYTRALNNMSETKQYQLKGMLKKLCDIYDVRKHRNLLVSSESFAYLFKEQELDSKVKSGLLLLAKDLRYKYGFPVLIVRPRAMLTTNYVNVPPALEAEFLRQFGAYAKPLGTVPDRVISSRRQGASDTRVHNVGSIYAVRMGDLWQSRFAEHTFGAFKYRFFQEGVLAGGSDCRLSPRIRVAVNYHRPFQEILELVTRLLEEIQTVLDGFDQAEKKTFDEKAFREGLNGLRPGEELSQTQVSLLLDMFTLTASEKVKYAASRKLVKILQLRSKPGEAGQEYLIRGTLMRDYLLRLLGQCAPNGKDRYQAFVPIGQTDAISILPILKLLEILECASYELRGGEKAEIFIRINDPAKLRRLADAGYSNVILQEGVRRHRASQKLLQDFFTTDLSDDERWDLIEAHFLGREEEVSAILAQGVPFS